MGATAGGRARIGGGVAMMTASRRPELVRKLVLVSTVLRADAYFTEMRALQQRIARTMADEMRSQAVEAFALLGGGKRDGGWDGAGRSKHAQLAILPGATHYEIFAKPALALMAKRFLVER